MFCEIGEKAKNGLSDRDGALQVLVVPQDPRNDSTGPGIANSLSSVRNKSRPVLVPIFLTQLKTYIPSSSSEQLHSFLLPSSNSSHCTQDASRARDKIKASDPPARPPAPPSTAAAHRSVLRLRVVLSFASISINISHTGRKRDTNCISTQDPPGALLASPRRTCTRGSRRCRRLRRLPAHS